jgi:hypothetical protein
VYKVQNLFPAPMPLFAFYLQIEGKKRVDPTRLELVTSAMRRRSEDFATVRYRSKNRLNKPNPRIVSSPMFAVVRVGCRQTVVSCVHEYCALKRSLIQGFAILSDTRTCCAGGLRARGSGKGVRETTGLFYAGLWIRTSGNSSFPGNSVNGGHGAEYLWHRTTPNG